MLWAMVNPDTTPAKVPIFCLPTGDEGPKPEWEYISTVQIDWTVWHFFKVEA